jgi:crotonobetainyl-CoA:carnitine CoA-transferase CaiB-like acyl-CoA transferase
MCSLMLADQGAEVIKIEQPVSGDYARWYVPRVGDYAAVFHAMNRNKSSVVLDLKQPEGQDLLFQLVKTADVLLESFRPQVSQKLGLDFATLSGINPRLILCSLSGFGQTGPLAHIAGHDLNFAGLSGVLAAGEGGVLPIQAMDFGGAYMAAFAISTALYQREKSGQGCPIDVALLDSGLSLMTLARAETFARSAPPRPAGEALTGGYACYRVYTCADGGALTLAALEPKFWETFCALAERPDLARLNFLDPDPAVQAQLRQELEALFLGQTRAAWVERLSAAETCANEVLTVAEAETQPQIQARQALYHADGVAHTFTPFHLGLPWEQRISHQAAPALGQDTWRILSQMGLGQAELDRLQAMQVIN